MGPSDLIIIMSAVLVQNWKYIIIITQSQSLSLPLVEYDLRLKTVLSFLSHVAICLRTHVPNWVLV